jgi:hypothetical protein
MIRFARATRAASLTRAGCHTVRHDRDHLGSAEGCHGPGVTCVGLSVKALMAWGAGPQALVKVERPQRSEDVGP